MTFWYGVLVGGLIFLVQAVWIRMFIKSGTWKPWEWTWEDWK